MNKTAFGKIAQEVRKASAEANAPATNVAVAGTTPNQLPQAAALPPAPHVEVKPKATLTVKKAEHCALGDRYPIDTPEEVKQASDYFDQYRREMTVEDRREYALKVAARADLFRVHVSDALRSYASTTPASPAEVKVAMDLRELYLRDETDKKVLRALQAKHASMVPETFVTILHEFDKQAGLDVYYGINVPDPYNSVYSTKRAEEGDMVVAGTEIGRTEDLKAYALTHLEKLTKYWGPEFAEKFRKNPVGTFQGLPVEQQRVLLRTVNSSLHGSASV
jgi:hypothetical protein